MRRAGLFAIVLAAVVASGCGSSNALFVSEEASSDYASGTSANYAAGASSRAAAGVAADYDDTESMSDTAYDVDGGTAVADVYDESALEELDPDYNVDSEDKDTADASDKGDIKEVDTSKKVIRNMNYSVETTDLDVLDQAVRTKVNELGGYIEDSSIDGSTVYDAGYYLGEDGNTYYDSTYAARSGNTRQYRYAYYTIRIPAQRLDQFAQAVEEGANVLSQSTSTQDITSSYVDTDSRRKSLEEELQILNEMASKAETIDELIQIESQRSDVRYQLENIKSQLKSMNDRVAYSTVNLNVTEVKVLTDTTAQDLTWQERVSNGFANSCERLIRASQEIAIWIASNAPMIVFYIILAIIALVILRIVLVIIAAILGIKRGRKAGNADEKGQRVTDTAAAAVIKADEVAADLRTRADSKTPAESAEVDMTSQAGENNKAE